MIWRTHPSEVLAYSRHEICSKKISVGYDNHIDTIYVNAELNGIYICCRHFMKTFLHTVSILLEEIVILSVSSFEIHIIVRFYQGGGGK